MLLFETSVDVVVEFENSSSVVVLLVVDDASATTYNAAVEHAFNSNMVTDPNTQATPLQEAYAESKSYVSRTSNAKSKLACWDFERQAGNRFKKEAKLLHLPCPQDREYKC